MNLTPSPPSHQAMEQAAEWFAILQSGTVTAAEQEQWRRWLSQPENQRAWQFVERISHRFDPIRNSPDRDIAVRAFQEASQKQMDRRQVLLGIGGLFGSGLLAWASWRYLPLHSFTQNWLADYHAATGEIREIRLPDNSLVWLNGDSALNINYSKDLRHLHLLRGEILIHTATDDRPFIVESEQGRLLALGTRFTVRQETGQTLVSVYQGAVQARTATTNDTAIIHADEQTHFTPMNIRVKQPADPAREAWSRGILIAENIPLHQVTQELQRYFKGHISLSPEVADLTVLGSYPIRDPEQALKMLASVMPLRIERKLPWWISIQPK